MLPRGRYAPDFVAACADLPAMHDALRGAFALPASPVGIVEQLARTLAGRRALLVLDNLEQLLPLANDPVRALLAARPGSTCSRPRASSSGRTARCQRPISPLEQPAPDATWDEMATSPALALFVDRAASVRTDFRLGPDNAAQAAEIVRTLGGLPLAIELAASRVRSFSPDQILLRLRGVAEGAPPGTRAGLSLLERKGVRDDGDPRHASMEQVIGWSWAQLDATQQRTLEAITVFPAGCDADAAFAVTEDADVALVIDELVQRSLLSVRAQRDGSLRFVITDGSRVRPFAARPRPLAGAAGTAAALVPRLGGRAGRDAAAGRDPRRDAERPCRAGERGGRRRA